jgi:Tfp pilus assembly protein PilO
MKTNTQTNTWIAILSAGAMAVAYLFLMFFPNQRAMKKESEDLSAKRNCAASAGSVAAAIEIARGELERAEAYNITRTSSASPEAELSAMLGKLDALAAASGATPTRFDPGPAVPIEKLRRVPVVVGCTGSFAQIARFLCDLEGLSQTVWIDGLKIELSGKDGDSVQCELDVSIFTDNPGDLDQANLAG